MNLFANEHKLVLVSQDLLGIIRILKVKGWFTIAECNSNLKVLKYKSNEASDKPESVPESMNVKELIGKAVSNWTHLRNFPFLIRKFIKDEDEPANALRESTSNREKDS